MARRQPGWFPGPWGYLLNRAAAPLVPFGFARRAPKPFAHAAYRLWANKRDTARRNFSHILGYPASDAYVDYVARDCFRQFGLYIAEMLHVQGWSSRTLTDRLQIEGEEHFDEAESLGKGIIFVSAHMGSAEVAAAVAVLRGYKITAVTERLRPRFVMDWAVACRAAMGITLLPVSGLGSGIRLLRALRKKEMVAFVIDAGISRGGGVPVTFFGRETVFPDGPARLARLSGAPIVFAVATRRSGGRFFAHIGAPIVSDDALDAEKDAQQITQRLATAFERYVRSYPSQWYAFREIWPE